MKKIIVLLSILLLAGCAVNNQAQTSESFAPVQTSEATAETTGNFSDEMINSAEYIIKDGKLITK